MKQTKCNFLFIILEIQSSSIAIPNIDILKISEGYNISIWTFLTHFHSAIQLNCKFLEFLNNEEFNGSLFETVSLDASYSQTACAANLSWNPQNTQVKVKARMEFRLGLDPSILTNESGNATIRDFTPAAGSFEF